MSPLARIFTILWLLIVWGTLMVTGCSEDGVLDPTTSNTASGPDALATGPTGSFQFDSADVLEVDLEQFLGGQDGVEAGSDVIGQIQHKSASKAVKAGKSFKLDLRPVKIKGGKNCVVANVTLEGESWVKSTGDGSAEIVDWLQFEFTPVVQFLEPVSIEIETKKMSDLADAQGLFQLWMHDEAADSWLLLEYGDDDGNHATFEVEQSGRYAIIGTDANMRAVSDLDFADPAEYEIIHWSMSRACKAGKDQEVKLANELRLVVGAGSLSSDATITADIWMRFIGHGGHATLEWVIVDLEPEMLFLQPVNLQLREKMVKNNAGDNGQYVLWYLNEVVSQWVHEDDGSIVQVKFDRGRRTVMEDFVEFEIEHFSKYAVGR